MSRGDADTVFYGDLNEGPLGPPLLRRGNMESRLRKEELLRRYQGRDFSELRRQFLFEDESRDGLWLELWDEILCYELGKHTSLLVSPGASFELGQMWGGPEKLRELPLRLEEEDLVDIALLDSDSPALPFLQKRMQVRTTPPTLTLEQLRSLYLASEGSKMDRLAYKMTRRYLARTICAQLQQHFQVEQPWRPYALQSSPGNFTLHLLHDGTNGGSPSFTLCRRNVDADAQDITPYAAWAETQWDNGFLRCSRCLEQSAQKLSSDARHAIWNENGSHPKHLLSEEACQEIADEAAYHSILRCTIRRRLQEDPSSEEIGRLLYHQALGATVRVLLAEMDRREGDHLFQQLLLDSDLHPDLDRKIRELPAKKKEELLLALLLGLSTRSSVADSLRREVRS